MNPPAVFDLLDSVEADRSGLGRQWGKSREIGEGQADRSKPVSDSRQRYPLGVAGRVGASPIESFDHEVGPLRGEQAEGNILPFQPPGDSTLRPPSIESVRPLDLPTDSGFSSGFRAAAINFSTTSRVFPFPASITAPTQTRRG